MSVARVSWWAPRAWALALALLMLGPALGPGYVLSYDMVWVPDLTLRPDFLGVGSGLPRAVPSDAVVAVLDELVPGMLLQKVVLVACLVVGGWGAVHLAPPGSLAGALVAVSVYQWNPYVAERLVIGHWPVLLGYAVLPWVIRDARRLRAEGRFPPTLLLTVLLGSLSISAGLVTAVALLAFGVRRDRWTRQWPLPALLLAANAPWLVAGLLHAADAVSVGSGSRVFALADVGSTPAPIAALGLGGIWNLDVVLPSRSTVLGIAWLVGLLLLVAVGGRAWGTAQGRRNVVAFGTCWAVGITVAVATWAVPDVAGWLMARVPGAAVARDGSRLLALCAPALASLAAYGAAGLVGRAGAPAGRAGLAIAVTLFPVAVLPDAAFGLSGRLDAVSYPSAYEETRALVARRLDDGVEGDVLVLPFTSYRAPGWNGGRKVLDPVGRFLPADFVTNDELSVSGSVVPGEDPRAREVAGILAAGNPASRSERLADAGIGLVVTDTGTAGSTPDVAGDVILVTDRTEVLELPGPTGSTAPTAWVGAMTLAWLLFAGALVVAVARTLLARRRSRPSWPNDTS